MKILIDTNILISLEDNKIVSENFSLFYRLAISNNCKILYHPQAVPLDIERDSNKERKEITQSKLKKYEPLENFSLPTESFISLMGGKKINDDIDNTQLYQLYKGYVDYFITEDKGIHTNAVKIDLTSRVLNISQIRKLLEELFTIVIPSHPILKSHSIRELESLFETSFFDSLKQDYGKDEFSNWLQKCVKEDRKCYSLTVNNELRALLIYNVESVEGHRLKDIYEKALKICTLKVSNTVFGIKLGELFINKMFEYCINQGLNYLYLTVYDKQTHLIKLLKCFGFYPNDFVNAQGFDEKRMIKCLKKEQLSEKINESNSIVNHPFYMDNRTVAKYAIPIRPVYYSKLFKDGKFRHPTLFDNLEESINEIQGNTIIKAYISNSKRKNLRAGDLLFFYASNTEKSIEPVGILESIHIINNFEDLWNLVSKKTVFSQEELIKMLQEKGTLNVIIFRLVTYLKRKISLPKIKKLKSFKNKIQTITEISEEDYLLLKDEGYFDRRYIID